MDDVSKMLKWASMRKEVTKDRPNIPFVYPKSESDGGNDLQEYSSGNVCVVVAKTYKVHAIFCTQTSISPFFQRRV